jgi:hypothetical protein
MITTEVIYEGDYFDYRYGTRQFLDRRPESRKGARSLWVWALYRLENGGERVYGVDVGQGDGARRNVLRFAQQRQALGFPMAFQRNVQGGNGEKERVEGAAQIRPKVGGRAR